MARTVIFQCSHARVLLIPTLIVLGMWTYFRGVVVPTQQADAVTHNRPRGNLSDLYPRWFGARELLLHGRDPYSHEVTAEIQKGYWGRTLSGQPGDPQDQAGFAYPLYTVFFLAPTIHLPFERVQLLFQAVAVVLSVISVWFWFRAFGCQPSLLFVTVASLLLLGSYPVVQALLLQQPALIVAGAIAAAMAAIAGGVFWAAGLALAVAMIKPQVTLPVATWLLFWAISNWQERKILFLSCSTALAVMVVGAELLLPGWIWRWRDALSAYAGYAVTVPSHVQLILGERLGGALSIPLLLVMAVFCWRTRYEGPNSDRFKLVVPLVLAVNLVASPVWHEYDLMFLLPAAILMFKWWNEVLRLKPLEGGVVLLSVVVLGWQWIGAILVSGISLVWPDVASNLLILPWLSILFAPIPLLVSLILMARSKLSS